METMPINKMSFLYERDKERGYEIVKYAIDDAKEIGNHGERRIALEMLLDNLIEVGLFLPLEQILLADKAFGKRKDENEQRLIKHYEQYLSLPDTLKSTYDMLAESFPDGISEEHYWIILYLLYDDMSDENLAIVMSHLVNKSYAIISNDIYRACQMEFDSVLLDEIENRLEKHGFLEWKKTD
ncbi:MAG: hypothetical protein K2K70_12985 [Lachnospiraceae bacterium]|nr:hypothetical protein [Lachnospiraceae bacterium]